MCQALSLSPQLFLPPGVLTAGYCLADIALRIIPSYFLASKAATRPNGGERNYGHVNY
jgi:hypothetical protein